MVTLVPFIGQQQNIPFSAGATTIFVGSVAQLTITHPGQNVVGSVESTVFSAVTLPFRQAKICFDLASAGTLDQAAAAASNGGPPVPVFGNAAFQAVTAGSPSTLTLPVLIQGLAPGTYNFGLCELPGFDGSYNTLITQGWFALTN